MILNLRLVALVFILSVSKLFAQQNSADTFPYTHSSRDTHNLKKNYLIYHYIKTDAAGNIIPWNNPEPSLAYDQVMNLCWNFWNNMRRDPNGLPYYMNHQVWEKNRDDHRGFAVSAVEMCLNAWGMYYAYTGNDKIFDNMRFIAEYFISHSHTGKTGKWPNMLYSYNTLLNSGIYDGDMILGPGYIMPDKNGDIGKELIKLYKMTNNHRFLETSIGIANTMAKNIIPGDSSHSPMPFKVNASTGQIGELRDETGKSKAKVLSTYSTNWAGTLRMFQDLIKMGYDKTGSYKKAVSTLIAWVKKYPMQTNKWGPYFEDVWGWSDTQINAVTMAMFIMDNPELFPNWKNDVQKIFNWVYKELGNNMWKQFHVQVVDEQTGYRFEGNSHTARQASAQLMYAKLTGDTSMIAHSIRQLNWCTYSVNDDGETQYPVTEVWITDCFGDFIQHYLRSMKYHPSLAPADKDHLLSSTSIIKQMQYYPDMKYYGYWAVAGSEKELKNGSEVFPKIYYETYDTISTEVIRVTKKPTAVKVNELEITETNVGLDGWQYEPMKHGGLLTIRHSKGNKIRVIK